MPGLEHILGMECIVELGTPQDSLKPKYPEIQVFRDP